MDFDRLQASDHFYYMCTKLFSDGAIHQYFTPYDTPYEAFINYMNVLSDFIVRVNNAVAKAQNKTGKAKAEPAKELTGEKIPATAAQPEEKAKSTEAKKRSTTTRKKK